MFVGGGVGGSDSCPAVGDDGASRSEGVGVEPGGGFAQKDVVHLLGLVCPDFPEEFVAQVSTTRAVTELDRAHKVACKGLHRMSYDRAASSDTVPSCTVITQHAHLHVN